MSFTRVPPFVVVPHVRSETSAYILDGGLQRLRDVVAGRDVTFPRSQGMALLQATDFPHKHRAFQAVLENEEESPEIRYLAAVNLGKIDTPAAVEILVRNRHLRDPRILAGVVKALGRIGNASALEAVSTICKQATGVAATQAAFAARLIAHRVGLKEHEAPMAEATGDRDRAFHGARPFRITRADDLDAEHCLRSVARQPFGIEFSEHPMYQIRCGHNSWMMLFNREYADRGAVRLMGTRKAFVGVVAKRSAEAGSYSVAYLVLSSPITGDAGVNIRIHRPNGKLTLSGTGQCEEGCMRFSIGAVPQPGAIAVKIEGIFEDGRLEVATALSTTFVQTRKREPAEELPG